MAQQKSRKNGQSHGPWIKKPHGFPPGLYVHKRGWAMRVDGRVKVVAAKIPPQEALTIFYRKMAEAVTPGLVTTQQTPPEMTQRPLEIEPKTTVAPSPLPVHVAPSISIAELVVKYLDHKTSLWRGGEFADRSLMSIREVLPKFSEAYPGVISDLTAEDFAKYRADLGARYKPNSLNRHVTNIRAMFSWAFRNYIITELPRWGDSFEKPSAEVLRKHRQKVKQRDGVKMFTAKEIGKLLARADDRLTAMILLGVNCAFGNTDIAKLPMSVIDLDDKIIDFPRPKTGEERRVPLWPETVKAIKKVMKARPLSRDDSNDGLLFLTKTGLPLIRVDASKKIGTRTDYVTLWFRDLVDKAGLKRNGRGFYGLRHTFYTIAGQTTDGNAVSRIAGHSLGGMASVYCQRIGDDRLRRVSDYVREQVLGVRVKQSQEILVSTL